MQSSIDPVGGSLIYLHLINMITFQLCWKKVIIYRAQWVLTNWNQKYWHLINIGSTMLLCCYKADVITFAVFIADKAYGIINYLFVPLESFIYENEL